MGELARIKGENVIRRCTAIATAVSLVVNLIIYFVARANGWIPDDVAPSTEAFGLMTVIAVSVLPVLFFGILLVVLVKYFPSASELFALIVLATLFLSIVIPFFLSDLDSSSRYVLIAMHIVTAGSILSLCRSTPR